MSFEEYLLLEEKCHGLKTVVIKDIPLWRLVRSHFRWRVLDAYPFTVKPNLRVKDIVVNNFKSFKGLCKLYFQGKRIDNVFFPHPRLFFVNGKYIERLTDPFIDYNDIDEKDYIILERHQNGIHKTPRYHSEKIVYLDFIDNAIRCFSIFYKPILKLKYKRQTDDLIDKLNKVFNLSNNDTNLFRATIYGRLAYTIIGRKLIGILLKKLQPKRVFVAPRITFAHIILYCNKHDITTIEFQHGVTIGKTILYTGKYDSRIDTNYFFSFGKDNISDVFGLPMDRIINIGFPYKNYLKSLNMEKYPSNTCLVISESHISIKIIDVISDIALTYPQYVFHIRCHPQEKLSTELLDRLKNISNIQIADNKTESFCAISQYEFVLGENSTVIYEAMSMHKRVGRLNYGGFEVKESKLIHGGFKINCREDFDLFMRSKYDDTKDSKDIYSDFVKIDLQQFDKKDGLCQ